MKKIELPEIKKLEVEMLKIIDKLCRNNNIQYFAIGGTLLGAIGHNGFIPWDDDIDIALTFENYQKLLKLLEKECINGKFKILNDSNNKNYYYPFSKMDRFCISHLRGIASKTARRFDKWTFSNF